MKIDRVIVALNNNPKYTKFWNLMSRVWKEKFDVTPTLIFNGTQEEFDKTYFDKSFGEFVILNRIESVSEPNPDWSVTWSLFYAASKFTNKICLLSGIDQIPIGDFFFKKISEIDNEKFIVSFSDAYKSYTEKNLGYFNTQTNVLYPSSHLVGNGKMFKKIFEIEDDWETEISKVYNSKERYYLKNHFYPGKLWGLDECYASEKISIYNNQDDIVYLDIFWNYWQENRIDLGNPFKSKFDINLVRNGIYSELTCKNFEGFKPTIDYIVNNIKKLE